VKKENDIIYLERHDEYYGEKAKIKNLILKAMPDNEARLIAVETGEVDIGVRIAQSGFDNAKKNEKLNAVSVDVGTIYGIALNSNAKALQDVRVRQAISYAIDNTSISAIATEGRFRVSDSVLPTDLDKDINVKLHSFDIAKAKDLLKEAGYADGLKLTATVYQIDFGVKGVTVIQSQLKVIGIDLSIETLETAAWSSKLMKKDYEMSIIAFNSPDSTTDGILYGKFNNKTGVLGYKNENVTALLNNARMENDKQKQNGLYKQALEIISDDALCVPWFEVSLNYVYSKSLKGLVINNRGYGGLNRYNTVYWE
jgi:peptide/nickel transport system substrate-binding protein